MSYKRLYNARYLRRPCKIYISAGQMWHKAVSDLVAELEDHGHTVMLDWTKAANIDPEQHDSLSQQRIDCINQCNLFIYFMDESILPHVELGMAMALEKQIVAFHYPTSPIMYHDYHDIVWLS